jgi:hypothetical protein
LYAGDPILNNVRFDTPIVYVVNTITGLLERQFAMPSRTITNAFSFGSDGLLYVLSGLHSRRESGAAELLAVNPATGAIEHSLHGYEYYSELDKEFVSDVNILDMFEWLPDGSAIFDWAEYSNNLTFAAFDGDVFDVGREFPIDGVLFGRNWRGSAVYEHTLWLWAQSEGRFLYQVALVPEPSTHCCATLLVAAVAVATPFHGRAFRRRGVK